VVDGTTTTTTGDKHRPPRHEEEVEITTTMILRGTTLIPGTHRHDNNDPSENEEAVGISILLTMTAVTIGALPGNGALDRDTTTMATMVGTRVPRAIVPVGTVAVAEADEVAAVAEGDAMEVVEDEVVEVAANPRATRQPRVPST
jgi:hypothetical protein